MILSGNEIYRQVENGNIYIDDFDKKRLNPNSYNLRLHDQVLVYKDTILDMKKDNTYRTIEIPKTGLTIFPGTLYLGRTVEKTYTDKYVPMLEGRSSVGRLGIYIHVTAGFGDIGFKGYWTLEISSVQPVVIYPDVEICQIYFHTVEGDTSRQYNTGKYQGNSGIQTSKLWMEFGEEK